jgi:chromosome segregation ATPase
VTISADSKRVKVLKKDVASLKNYIAGLETRIGSMDDEIKKKVVTISDNEQSIRSLEGTNQKLKSDMEATAATILEREGRIDELTK